MSFGGGNKKKEEKKAYYGFDSQGLERAATVGHLITHRRPST